MFQAVKIVLCAFWCLLAVSANAQSVQSFEGMMNNIIRGTPGITNVTVSAGVRASATGTVSVPARNLVIPVPTTVAADIGRASIARGAARIGMRVVPWVGTALLVNDLVGVVQSAGYYTCPPPSFFCKRDPAGFPPTDTLGAYTQGLTKGACRTTAENCSYMAAAAAYCGNNGRAGWDGIVRPYPTSPNPGYSTVNKWYSFYFTCFASGDPLYQVYQQTASTCPAGYHIDTGQCVKDSAEIPSLPATLDEVNAAIAAKLNADSAATLRIKNSMDAIAAQNPGMEPAIDVSTAPLVVTAPPVTTPATTVSTETIPNADGTTSTKTVKEATTVTPTVGSPSTAGSPNVSYPSTTTQTTTIVNNTTNVTTTTITNITNAPPAPAPVKPVDLPTDYNREATQQKILDTLNTPITDTPPDGAGDLKAVKAQNDVGAGSVAAINETSSGLKSWLPTINTASCANPLVPIPVTGGMLAVPICDSVDIFAKFISAVISVFALYGCIREVQAAMKA